MEGSDEECHRTGTSCEGGESQRGVDILKVALCGLVPVRRACVCVCVCEGVECMSMFTIKDRGITVSWVPHRHTQYNSTTAHTTATTKRYI